MPAISSAVSSRRVARSSNAPARRDPAAEPSWNRTGEVCPEEERLPRLHHWELVRLLGRGSWSRVYQARPRGADPRRPADYVVKLVPDDISQWPMAAASLERESLVASQVVHKNLVSVLVAHVHAIPCYTVMPFLRGVTLRRLLDRRRLPLALSFWITRQVAEALEVLHAAGWAHADIKPENILVSPQGHATLIDLGLARRLDSEECSPAAPRVGTPAYMPPEVAYGDGTTTWAVDVYSLGVTLREMLTGQRPRPATQLETAKVEAEPPGISSNGHAADLPAPVAHGRAAELLEAMLHPAPAHRPTAATLARQLASLEIEFFAHRRAE